MKENRKNGKQTDTTVSNISRRKALGLLGGATVANTLGLPIPFIDNLNKHIIQDVNAEESSGKDGLTLLNDRPLNMETPPHLLDDKVTPAERFFIRNNGIPPFLDSDIIQNWRLVIDGEVKTPLNLSIQDLKTQFTPHTFQLQLECGGNGRKFYNPSARGNQWSFGAIGCPEWTGVRLHDVLKAAGVKPSAVYTAHYGADEHLSGDPARLPISRGVPIEKAMDEHNLIAWAMNGDPIPFMNGAPLRLVVPGWPGSCSQKWLTKITIRDQVHDGPKMTGSSYRVPAYPVPPGAKVPDEDMKIIESMPVKSLITYPETGARVAPKVAFEVRGHAWAGDLDVIAVDISLDFGATWQSAILEKPVNKYAWQHWYAELSLPQSGYYEVWARATDSEGKTQPATTPGWNPKGYLNNMQHRIAVFGVA
ncbi:sulfite oxidase [Kordiimonas sp. SCSIO 12610]|uniref:sulfite oxidase n=1 Tax=Kordiimonas sp. SCSIO 12610 TaxID=2829597 RepID=UPI002108774A|nr:sulfite oxidase [Kordiimonas sp. SCSIO 12610]UTW54633.1 sulfite oxidase [Kordiimonas sp. SCSIO 12610]